MMTREIMFEVVPLLSRDAVCKQEITSSTKTKGRGLQGQGLSSQASFRGLCGMGGMQIGKTKVFFRQVRWCLA